MACQVIQHNDGTNTVAAPNGEGSILYNKILALDQIDSDYDALNSWMKIYTPTFKEWYGMDWETISDTERSKLIKEGYLDKNGEPALFYRGDLTGKEQFSYSNTVGKFGQGIYLADNTVQAEEFAKQTNQRVFPVFLRPAKSLNFKSVNDFLRAVAEFNEIKTVPKKEHIENYVKVQHLNNVTIIGKGLMGKEFNIPSKDQVRTIFSKGITIQSGILFDNTSVASRFMTKEFQEARHADQFILEFIEKLANNFGIDYSGDVQMVSKDEAALLTEGADNPWNNQPAFFHDGKVYFVKGQLSYKTAFHEFAHPFVRTLQKENPGLFNKLLNEILKENQGIEFLNEALIEYPTLNSESPLVKEEVVVKALTYIAKNQNMLDPKIQPSKGIMAAIKKFFYGLKEILRKLTGKRDFKALSPTVTLEELAKMMIDKSWNVDLSLISEENVVAYMRDYVEYANDLQKFNNSEGRKAITRLILDNTRLTIEQIEAMRNDQNYEDLKIVLAGKQAGTTLDQMRSNLKQHSDKAKALKAADAYTDELKDFENKVTALSWNLSELDLTVTRIKQDITELADETDQKKALGQVSYYIKSLDQWAIWLDSFLDSAYKAGLRDNSNPLRADLLSIRESIRNGKEDVTRIYENALRDELFSMFEPMNKSITREANIDIDVNKKRLEKYEPGSRMHNLITKEITKLEQARDKAVVDKDKMLDYITGQMGDIGTWHAWLESYTASQDPSIASFGMYIKSNLSDVQTKVHQKYNEFVTKLEPLTDKLGISPSQIDKFSDEFLFTDSIYKRNDETGEIEEYKVYTFLNEFTGWNYEMAKLNERVNLARIAQDKESSPENLKEFSDAYNARSQHKKLFYNDQFVDAFNHADSKLTQTAIGRKAKELKDEKLNNITEYQRSHLDNHELYDDFETVERFWRDYKQLFSIKDEYGQPKTGEALEIAEVLIQHREDTREFYEYELLEGVFQKALEQFTQKETIRLMDSMDKNSPEFEEALNTVRDEWIRRNTQVKIKSTFYEERSNILAKIKEIMSLVKADVKFDAEWQVIIDSMTGRRDANGQPVAPEMTDEHKELVKNLQEKMELAKKDVIGIGGLTPADQATMNRYYKMLDAGERLSPKEYKNFQTLKKQKSELGLPKGLKEQLFKLFDRLDEMQNKVPTDYYMEQVNNFYLRIQDKENAKRRENGEEPLEYKEFDLNTIEDLTDPYFANDLIGKDEEFKQWFEKNHILKEKTDKLTREKINVYERIYVWSVVKPSDEKYLEKTEVLDASGDVVETIIGVPTVKYWKRKVKAKYYTGYNKARDGEFAPTEASLIKDGFKNIKGQWLPRTLSEMKKMKAKYTEEFADQPYAFDKYINYDYLELKDEADKAERGEEHDELKVTKFKTLELLKEFHLDGQKGLEKQAMLGLELPRMRKDLYEYVTSGELKGDTKDKWKQVSEGFAQFWAKRKDDQEDGLNFEQEMSMVEIDMYSGENGKVPIRGKYLLELDQVSRDITGSMMMYYQSAEQNKKLKEMQPMARAMQKLAENQPLELKGLTQMTQEQAKLKRYVKGDVSNRKKVIDAMVETFFEGKKLKGANNNATTIKLINNALGMASHTFFAFDLTSALKNHIGAQFQIALEGAGGKYFKYKNWHRGRPWAESAMWQISGQIYSKQAKSLSVQIIEVFDAIQGRFDTKFGESLSRSFARDAANLTWTTSHRKWLETQATLQLFSAIMHDTMVEQTIDGETKEIRYINAWEIDKTTNTIKLKEGIDKKWDIDGDEFKRIKFNNHEVSNLLQGAYADMDQPMVNRFILWRMVSSMRKFFTKMFLNRYGTRLNGKAWKSASYEERYNMPTQSMHMGFYMRNLASTIKAIETGGKSLLFMSRDEVRAFKMGILEIAKIMLLTATYSFVFGFDDDDSDRWKKLKARSGALPSFVTDEEWSEGWNVGGFLSNHLLLLAMHVEAENEHFIPLPGFGLSDMIGLTSDSSIAAGPSINTLKVLFYDLWYTMTGEEKVYYKKDVGALKWQQADSNKFWIHFSKMAALSGKFIDPVTSIKNFRGSRENYTQK